MSALGKAKYYHIFSNGRRFIAPGIFYSFFISNLSAVAYLVLIESRRTSMIRIGGKSIKRAAPSRRRKRKGGEDRRAREPLALSPIIQSDRAIWLVSVCELILPYRSFCEVWVRLAEHTRTTSVMIKYKGFIWILLMYDIYTSFFLRLCNGAS